MKKNIVIGAVCLIIGLAAGWLWNLPVQKTGGLNIGTRSIEDFLPGIRENRGIFTALNFFVSNASSTFAGPVNVTSTTTTQSAIVVRGVIGVGTTTGSGGDIVVDTVAATSTLRLQSSGAFGSCIEFSSGTSSLTYRMYLGDPVVATAISRLGPFAIEQGTCE